MEREILQFLKEKENADANDTIINDLLLRIAGFNDPNTIKLFLLNLHNKKYIEVSDLSLFGVSIAGKENNLNTYIIKARIRLEGKLRLKQIYAELKFEDNEDLQLAILLTIASGQSNMRQTVFETITNKPAFFTLKEDVFTKIWNELKEISCLKEIYNNPREVYINPEKDCISYFNNIKTERQQNNQMQSNSKVSGLQQSGKKITIFLASSSELAKDREKIEIFIHRENKRLNDSAIFINLEIWEDFIDAMSQTRLQDEYNKVVKASDIFLSLFFKKIGKYTIEEFETAFGQFKNLGKPFIYTYFKKAPTQKNIPNEKNLSDRNAFETKLKNLGHFPTLYKNIDDLKYKFKMQLEKLLPKL